MKKSILNLEGVQTLTKKQQGIIKGAHGEPSAGSGHASICGKPGYPACKEK